MMKNVFYYILKAFSFFVLKIFNFLFMKKKMAGLEI